MTPVGDQAKWLDRVTALLNKAESSEFPEEAELFTAKANELMAKFAISDAMIEFKKGATEASDVVEIEDLWVPAPYALDRIYLLWNVAGAMGCKMYYIPVRRDGSKTRTNNRNHDLLAKVVGYRSDIEKVKMMFESLVKQEVVARAFAVKNDTALQLGFGSKKVFSASFIRGFSSEAGRRLQEAYRAAEKDGGSTAALAVVDRKKKVNAKFDSIGVSSKRSKRKGDTYGYAAGQQAGAKATLHKAVR